MLYEKRNKMEEILIVTTNEVAGYRITEVYGEVFGLTTRSRNLFSSAGQQMKTVVGGEIMVIQNFNMKPVKLRLIV